MDASEQAAEKFLLKLGLRIERFSKEEMRCSKTPDFRAFSGDGLELYCEAKHLQRDKWLEGLLREAQPGDLAEDCAILTRTLPGVTHRNLC